MRYPLDTCGEETETKENIIDEIDDCSSATKKQKIEEEGTGKLKCSCTIGFIM